MSSRAPYFAGSATTVWICVSPENSTIGATTPTTLNDDAGRDQRPLHLATLETTEDTAPRRGTDRRR